MARPRDHIDWQQARALLTQGGSADAPERARRLLQERARRLATPPPPPERVRLAAVALATAGERYAVPAELVVRVQRAPGWSRLPRTAPFVLGLVALADRPCPLLDLAALLGHGAADVTPRWAVVLGAGDPVLAFAADEAAFEELAPDALHPPRRDPEGVRRGVTADGRVVLDGAALLAYAVRRCRDSVAGPSAPGAGPGDPPPAGEAR